MLYNRTMSFFIDYTRRLKMTSCLNPMKLVLEPLDITTPIDHRIHLLSYKL